MAFSGEAFQRELAALAPWRAETRPGANRKSAGHCKKLQREALDVRPRMRQMHGACVA
jgi:hypothetical protein